MKSIISFMLFWQLSLVHQAQAQSGPSFINDNNSQIHYHQQGNGSPAVIFVSGMAHDHTTWKAVQDSLSANTLTLSYDRSGLGQSEYHGEKKDITTMANEINDVMKSAGVPEPFILVAHSLGCQIIKKYASMYPKKVKALVFVDPGYDEEILQSRISDSLWQARDLMLKKYVPQFNAGQLAEMENRNGVCKEADKIKELPKVPVVMFTATMVTNFPASAIEQQVKKERHLKWLQDMPGAKHLFVNTSWHYIHTDAPQQVVKEVQALLR